MHVSEEAAAAEPEPEEVTFETVSRAQGLIGEVFFTEIITNLSFAFSMEKMTRFCD